MSWRAQNVLSLLVVAALFLLNCLPAHSHEETKQQEIRDNGTFGR
jgi:hypothetical protein